RADVANNRNEHGTWFDHRNCDYCRRSNTTGSAYSYIGRSNDLGVATGWICNRHHSLGATIISDGNAYNASRSDLPRKYGLRNLHVVPSRSESNGRRIQRQRDELRRGRFRSSELYSRSASLRAAVRWHT